MAALSGRFGFCFGKTKGNPPSCAQVVLAGNETIDAAAMMGSTKLFRMIFLYFTLGEVDVSGAARGRQVPFAARGLTAKAHENFGNWRKLPTCVYRYRKL